MPSPSPSPFARSSARGQRTSRRRVKGERSAFPGGGRRKTSSGRWMCHGSGSGMLSAGSEQHDHTDCSKQTERRERAPSGNPRPNVHHKKDKKETNHDQSI